MTDAGEVARRCDAVWVCTPTSAHRGAVDEALAAGRAVFCEKPLDVDLARASALVDAVRSSGWPARAGWCCGAHRCSGRCATSCGAGRLGAPMAVVFRDDQYFPIQGTYASQWRADVSQAGGGCLIEHSIHDLDILRFCFGEVDSVMARTANHAGHQGIEDLAAVTLSLASGLEAQLTSVWHDILSRGSTRRLEVFCREGMVWLDDEFRGPLHVQTSDGTEERACPSPDGWTRCRCPTTRSGSRSGPTWRRTGPSSTPWPAGGQPEPGLDVALEAHRLVDASYRSAAGGGRPSASDQPDGTEGPDWPRAAAARWPPHSTQG